MSQASGNRGGRAWINGGLSLAAACLTLCRWLTVTEGAIQGETLVLAAGWLALAAGWFCAGGALPTRWRALDVAVGLLTVGHLISGTCVLILGGERRVALNLFWEWASLGAGWWVLRGWFQMPAVRHAFGHLFVATCVVLAGLGVYQRYVWYPQLAARYQPLFEEIDRRGPGAGDARRQLSEAQIPTEEPAYSLWKNRILYSREPFGQFALTNTFAGLMLVGSILAVSRTWVSINNAAPPSQSLWCAGQSLGLLWCLLLTQSRTAWAGGLVVLGATVIHQGLLWLKITSRNLRIGLVSIASFGLIVIVLAGMSGRLDAETLPGPLKSLGYRFQYWRGTLQMLLAQPLAGSGLGNFRQQYLPYRLPASSEEIADPHNWLLDLWANGTPIALCGGLAFVASLAATFGFRRREAASPSETANPANVAHDRTDQSASVWWGGLLAPVIVLLGPLVAGDGWHDEPFFLALALALVGAGEAWLVRQVSIPPAALVAGLTALLLHLCGAGGMEMPGIVHLILVLAAWLMAQPPTATGIDSVAAGRSPEAATNMVAEPSGKSVARSPSRYAWAGRGCAALIALAAVIACGVTSIRPVALAAIHSLNASNARDSVVRVQELELAAAADPLAPLPWRYLAQLRLDQWRQQPHQLPMFDQALADQQQALSRDPAGFHDHLAIGRAHWERWERTRNASSAVAAARALEQAVLRHPTSAEIQAECALALAAAGESAAAQKSAQQALEQDDLNHRMLHFDRLLSKDLRSRLTQISSPGAQ